MIRCYLALAVLVLACAGRPAAPPASDGVAPYEWTTPSRDGTGKVYLGREISHVMGHRGAGWLERPEREAEERPEEVIDRLRLAPDDTVADIGAGTGYFTFRISRRLPRGRVYAVDIQPEMLALLEARKEELGAGNVELVLASEKSSNLPRGEIDLALFVDVYHELAYPFETLRALRQALRSGGRVVLVEYRGEDPSVPIKPLHKMTEEQAKREMEAAGLRWLETLDFLPSQHVLIFEKP